jgi:ferredoxin-nitrite reductase
MNKIEALKSERDGLDVTEDLVRFAREGWRTIADDDKERLKWVGVFQRKPTPGHFMMRIRMANGILTAAQARLLGQITKATGRNIADVTTRQQIQLRWVTIEEVPAVIARLEEAGLSSLQTGMDNIRGIVGCPATGLTPRELFDTAPIAAAFQQIFLGNKAFTNLPRKFNVTITGCLEHCTPGETQDISMTPAIATRDGREIAGLNVAVGGKQGSGGPRFATALDAFVTPEEAAEVCAAIALLFRDHGPREARSKARLAFLVDEWGGPRFRRELEARLGHALPPAGRDARAAKSTDHIGIFRQREPGLNYVGLKTPVGRVRGDQLDELARLAERYGRGELRLTPSQNVLVPHIPDVLVGELTREPLLRELPYNPTEIQRGLVSCTGTDFCNLALIDTKTRALALAHEFESRIEASRPLTVRWSGCPASCGNHHTADVGLQGCKVKVNGKIVDGVHVFVGGRGGLEPRAGEKVFADVPCDELPEVLDRLIRFFPRGDRKKEEEEA